MKLKTTTILAVTSLGIAAAQAAVISINVTDDGPGAGAASAGNTAGAILSGYWNTIGTDGQALSGTNISSLTNDSGTASGVSIAQSANQGGFYNQGSLNTGFSGTIGNAVMENFADSPGNYTYTLNNVNAGVGSLYDVYVYTSRVFSNTGVTQFDVNGQTLFLSNESTVGDYSESGFATQALAEANLSAGNYVKFSNVSLDTLTIGITGLTDTTNGGNLAAVNGIQIVSVPEPSSAALLGLGGLALILRRRK